MNKILILIPQLGGGGAEMHAIRLANSWAEQTLEKSETVVVVAVFREGRGYSEFLNSQIKLEKLIPAKLFLKLGPIGRLFGATVALRQYLKENKVFAVLSFLSWTNLVLRITLGTLRGSDRPKRVIMGIQNVPSALYRKWPVLRWMDRLALPQADNIVVPTQGIRRELGEIFLAKNISVISNCGIEIGKARSFQERNPFVLVSAGRLIFQKNYPLLLEAFQIAQQKINLQLFIYGEGEERAALLHKAKQLGVEEHVFFPGNINDLKEKVANANLFLSTSLFEGFGNAIIEAMAVGTPVIATRCSYGPMEIITDGENGRLVYPDASAVAQAVVELLGNQMFWEKLSIGGQRKAEEFLPEKIVTKYVELMYRNIL